MNILSESIIFVREDLSRQDRPGHIGKQSFIPKCYADLYQENKLVPTLGRINASFLLLNHKSESLGRTGAVVSVADYGLRGPWFETWPVHRSLWP